MDADVNSMEVDVPDKTFVKEQNETSVKTVDEFTDEAFVKPWSRPKVENSGGVAVREDRLYIPQLPPLVSKGTLRKMFSKYGKVRTVYTNWQKRKRYALITFYQADHARAALAELNGAPPLMLYIRFATLPEKPKNGEKSSISVLAEMAKATETKVPENKETETIQNAKKTKSQKRKSKRKYPLASNEVTNANNSQENVKWVAKKRDDAAIFGEHVAYELRKLKPLSQTYAKFVINDLLFKTALKEREGSSFETDSQVKVAEKQSVIPNLPETPVVTESGMNDEQENAPTNVEDNGYKDEQGLKND